MAYMGKKTGNVVVIDLANTERSPVEIVAHETAINYMTLSNDGDRHLIDYLHFVNRI
jgi:WD repeat-containing protein 45